MCVVPIGACIAYKSCLVHGPTLLSAQAMACTQTMRMMALHWSGICIALRASLLFYLCVVL